MKRDFMFFVTGIPVERCVHNQEFFFMAAPGPEMLPVFDELAKRVPEFETFRMTHGKSFICFGLRNDLQDEQEATKQAWELLSGILDAYSVMMDEPVPHTSNIFLLRTGDSEDAAVKGFLEHGWAQWAQSQSDAVAAEEKWMAAKGKFFDALMPLFDLLAGEEAKRKGELALQLLYSTKMFRAGADSHVFGIQYLCKFSALEGLICGSATKNKGKLIQTRLGMLFGPGVTKTQIEDLWERRCAASHQAKAFYFEQDPDALMHSIYIDRVEYLFRGVLTFALTHLNSCATVDQLWAKAGTYKLPDFAAEGRPPQIIRGAVHSLLAHTRWTWKGAGVGFDNAMGQVKKSS